MSDTDRSEFEKRSEALLKASAEGLDAATRSRLNRARQAALEVARARRGPNRLWLPALGSGVAAASAVALVLLWPASRDAGTPFDTTDFDVVMAGESFEMLEDLEFYAWLGTLNDAG